jgi:tetratricopeptide (TPR) repeat protein
VTKKQDNEAKLLKKGMLAYKSGRYEEATAVFRDLIRQHPDQHEAHFTLGVIQFRSGQTTQAMETIQHAVALNPLAAHYLMTLGVLQDSVEDFQGAVASFRQALNIKPDDAMTWGSLGETYRKIGQLGKATACLENAIKYQPSNAEMHRRLGLIQFEQEQTDAALASLENARQLNPESAETLISLASMERSIGRKDDAIGHLQQAVALAPDSVPAHNQLAQLQPGLPDDERIDHLEKLAAAGRQTSEDAYLLHFTLGQLYADTGLHDAAFKHYEQGNRERARTRGGQFSLEDFTAQVDGLIANMDASFFEERSRLGSADQTPVFILGMPRSGTTLLERIIASHPDGYGAGELSAIGQLRRQMTAGCAGPQVGLKAMGISADLYRQAASSYLEHLRGFSADAQRIVDKMPGNFLNLWLPAIMLPQAGIIHTRRSAPDTCLSCFVTDFANGHGYRNDLRTLGLYYRQYRRLMDHWRAVLGDRILDVQYEDMVVDLEAGSRRLLDFCGLSWDPACLEYHRSRHAVRTASTVQVRKAIYTTSVGRWRHYAKDLEPLLEALGPELMAEAELLETKIKN